MTPLAEPASPAAASTVTAPEKVLQEGETVILAVKPSGWFVLISSMPVIIAVAAVGVIFAVGSRYGVWRATTANLATMACLAAGMLRIVVACLQWLGRLYILTDRRIIRLRGVLHVDVLARPLKDVRRIGLTAGPAERMLGLGTLVVECPRDDVLQTSWVNLARPAEVEQIVGEAVRRAK